MIYLPTYQMKAQIESKILNWLIRRACQAMWVTSQATELLFQTWWTGLSWQSIQQLQPPATRSSQMTLLWTAATHLSGEWGLMTTLRLLTLLRLVLRVQDWNILVAVQFKSVHQVKHYLERINREGVARVKMFFIVTIAYLLFWGPLFLVCISFHIFTIIPW